MRAWGGAALAAMLAAGAALAQEGTDLAPETAPTPETRPEAESETVPQLIPPEAMEDEAPDGGDGASALTPPEEADPSVEAAPAEGLSFGLNDSAEATDDTAEEASQTGEPAVDIAPPSPDPDPEIDPGPPMREVLAETGAELTACLAALDELGVTYQRADPIEEAENPDCGIANPLVIYEIAPGTTLEPSPTLRCDAALAAARWVADVALPLSRKLEGRGRLVALEQGTAYLCRPRADGETSEHAYGNALDVMAFRFEKGDPITVQPRADDGTLEEAFQAAVEAGACLDFTTVLGPGQEDHDDHLHLDVKERDGGFRICQ